MPPIHHISSSKTNYISKIFPQDLWEFIFPYSKASSVWTHDNLPFWTYRDFLLSIEWMNSHNNNLFHNFASDSSDDLINLLELAAFLGNFHQECGEPSLSVPYPWSYPPVSPKGLPSDGPAGGCLGILEGTVGEIYFTPPPFPVYRISKPLPLSNIEIQTIGTGDTSIGGYLRSLTQLNQPQFGLGTGTGNGVVFMDSYVAVSDDGTLWGTKPTNTKVGNVIDPVHLPTDGNIRKTTSKAPYSQYGGRGAIQLSYNYNYSDCSIALFDDYRLAKYPNLIITTDRYNWNNEPFYFGFPGPNENGQNQLPIDILHSTPPARQLAFITCLWFWMDNKRSGRTISCHNCMLQPFSFGITSTNMIINNQSGCTSGTWAFNKLLYYKRICKIFNIPSDIINQSIVCPVNNSVQLK